MEAKLDELATVAAGIDPARLRMALKKDTTITFRLSELDKESMQATAARLGLTVTEYLTRLNAIAADKLEDPTPAPALELVDPPEAYRANSTPLRTLGRARGQKMKPRELKTAKRAVLACIKSGGTAKAAAAAVGVSGPAVWKWRQDDDTFSKAYDKAKNA